MTSSGAIGGPVPRPLHGVADGGPDGQLFDRAVEAMPPERMRMLQLDRLRAQLAGLAPRSPFYADLWAEHGFDPTSVDSLEDFDAPLTTKEMLRDSQLEAPPLGRHAGVAMAEVVRVHASSGTTGRPSYVGITLRDLEDWTQVVARVLYSEGMRPDDVVVHAFGLGFFVGGLPLKDATERIGATFVPIGTGSSDRVVQSIRDLGGTVLMSTPSYATYLAEYCRHKLGLEPAELGLRKLLLGAEPGASIPAVRARLEADYGAVVGDGMGNADVFPIYLASCPEQDGLHLCAEDQLLTELIDPASGERLDWTEGAEGELVVTHLQRECVPLVRFRVRDRVVVAATSCPCGRTSPRLHCVGRTDDLLFVAGVNVWPSAVKDVVASMAPRTTGAMQIVLSEPGPLVRPPMRVQVEYGLDVEDLDELRADVENLLRDKLVVATTVDLVPPNSLPRWEMKAQLVKRRR
ncbi:phenylacetate--CoA ligase family protein [Pseudonocardia kujensis]|uniref:phenylacetate--CoA ligase family protein n=1 Tax=Pseudonocardia kujensis TaxID=1128675 RepID=UPI001E31529B|nr:phenylacetate--CoA ligase family protein [Pseudonocardia kujensis]MCE0766040.1 phenylacetate--CoA ligase family protein [Pseudonocardia kujensis]